MLLSIMIKMGSEIVLNTEDKLIDIAMKYGYQHCRK